jgi:hypothetical protein
MMPAMHRVLSLIAAALLVACKADANRPPLDLGPSHGGASGGGVADASADGSFVPTGVTVLAQGLQRPQGIALDPHGIFLTLTGELDDGGIAPSAGSVIRIPREGGATQVLASSQDWPYAIRVQPTALFWADRGTRETTGALMVLRAGASVPEGVSTAETDVAGLATDPSYAYWSSALAGSAVVVSRTPIDGGAPDPLSTLPGAFRPGHVAVDATSIYFIAIGTEAAIYRTAITGGPPEALATLSGATPRDLLVVDATLFITDARADGAILTLPTSGGAVTAFATGQKNPSHLARDKTRVYWTLETTDGAVMAAPIAGGTPTALAEHLDRPRAIAADDGAAVYVTTASALLRVAK